MAVELAMASSATIKVFIFMVDVVLVLMAGRVALPFLFITSVECVLLFTLTRRRFFVAKLSKNVVKSKE